MKIRPGILILITAAVAAIPTAVGPALASTPPVDEAVALHASFDRLLAAYVVDGNVDYEAWSAHDGDKAALHRYVEELAALDPAEWPAKDALAYWINVYNGATLRLVLENYPLDSIKDLGGFLKTSPWDRSLVTVAGRKLTLNNIENDIIRPVFADPRAHFALNCASVGCPPLSREAYVPARLNEQLDAACRNAINRDRWVRIDGDGVALTKIFEWYGDDFRTAGSSVLAFVRRYRTEPLPDGDPKVTFMPYDWSLNRAQKAKQR